MKNKKLDKNTAKLVKVHMKSLLKSQQGEMDAVLMYERLAKTVRIADRQTFRDLARAEQYHADFFREYTGKNLKPKKTKSIMLPMLYRVLGRKRTYKLIANGEYSAADKYEHLIEFFPGVERIKNDEVNHGDLVLAMI